MSEETLEFSLASVMSVVSRRLMCDPRAVRGLLEYMSDISPMPQTLAPVVAQECAEVLKTLHPNLASIDVSTCNPSNYLTWLEPYIKELGYFCTVQKLPEELRIKMKEFYDSMPPGDKLVRFGGDDALDTTGEVK